MYIHSVWQWSNRQSYRVIETRARQWVFSMPQAKIAPKTWFCLNPETYPMFTWDMFTWGKCHFTIGNVTQYNRNVNLPQVNVSCKHSIRRVVACKQALLRGGGGLGGCVPRAREPVCRLGEWQKMLRWRLASVKQLMENTACSTF